MTSSDKPIEYFAIYTRQSVESQLAFNSCSAQFDQCMEYANKKLSHCKWIGQHFDDQGISGATVDRPALNRLRSLIADKAVRYILFTYIDRLSRSLTDSIMLLEEFQKAGVHIHFVKTPELSRNANGSFLINILASFAQFEREMMRERIAETRAYLKKNGRRLVGRIPLGYDADPFTKQLTINKEEASQVSSIFSMALHMTPNEITLNINQGRWTTKLYKSKRSGNMTGGPSLVSQKDYSTSAKSCIYWQIC
jgi:site-specific DNA recombinase